MTARLDQAAAGPAPRFAAAGCYVLSLAIAAGLVIWVPGSLWSGLVTYPDAGMIPFNKAIGGLMA